MPVNDAEVPCIYIYINKVYMYVRSVMVGSPCAAE
jgi:hypothetical protein